METSREGDGRRPDETPQEYRLRLRREAPLPRHCWARSPSPPAAISTVLNKKKVAKHKEPPHSPATTLETASRASHEIDQNSKKVQEKKKPKKKKKKSKKVETSSSSESDTESETSSSESDSSSSSSDSETERKRQRAKRRAQKKKRDKKKKQKSKQKKKRHSKKKKQKVESSSSSSSTSSEDSSSSSEEEKETKKKSETVMNAEEIELKELEMKEAAAFKAQVQGNKPKIVDEDDLEAGPMPMPEPEEMGAASKGSRGVNYGGALLPGEGQAIAQFVQKNMRIPRRGEIGWSSTEVENLENMGYVMSGSRHKRMNAIRIRKENQVYSAEEKRALALITFEEKQQKENKLLTDFREMLQARLEKDAEEAEGAEEQA